jgi:hypothetical protein
VVLATTWTCSVCGEVHRGSPLEWGFAAPDLWDTEQDGADGFLNSDLCVVARPDGGHDRFVRGVIEIPIIDGARKDEDSFGIGAWVSLSESNFNWYVDHPEADEEEQGEPWFGWLSNRIPVYRDTLNLKTNVCLGGDRWRPSIRVQPTDHPLARDQHDGITIARARELSALWHHEAG